MVFWKYFIRKYRTKNPTPTPSVVSNPTPHRNLRLLTTPTPQPCVQWHFISRYDTHTAQGNRAIAIPQKFFRC